MGVFAGKLSYLRKQSHMTQEELAGRLHISFQAVSKWENGQSLPDISLLGELADIFCVTIDQLLGHTPGYRPATQYEDFYQSESYYWGIEPSPLCYEILKLRPPVKPYRVLDIGCGEGKDAVFLARNGLVVSAFDASGRGLEKGEKLASFYHVQVHFFQADIQTFRLSEDYDILFSSGVLHYIDPSLRGQVIVDYQAHTALHGLNAFNAFVEKPFIAKAPDEESPYPLWRSGELALLYHDWHLHQFKEDIFDCHSSGIPHQHCMDTMIAEKRK